MTASSPTPAAGPPPTALEDGHYALLSFGQMARRLAVSSIVYGVGAFVLSFGRLLLLPIYWQYLRPADYGILALADIFRMFLAVFLGLGVADSVTRFFHAWTPSERSVRLGSIWLFDWATSLALGIPIVLFGGPLVSAVIRQVPFDPYLRLAGATAVLASFSNTPLATLRIQEQPRRYVGCGLFSFAVEAAVSLWCIAALGYGVLGVLYGQLAAAAAMVPVFTVIMLRRTRLAPRRAHVAEAVRYSLPLVPSGALDSVIEISGRFFLEKWVTLSQLGLYSLADTIASVLRVLGRTLKSSWLPFAMRTANERPDAASVIGRMATLGAAGIVLAALAIALFSRDLVALIGDPAYAPIGELVPWLLIPYVFFGMGTVFSGGYAIARRTEFAPVISVLHLAVTLVSCVVLIPRYGVYGAIAAAALGPLVRVTAAFVISQRLYRIQFEWSKVIGLMIIGLAAYLVGTELLPSDAPGAVGRALIGAAYVALIVWSTGLAQGRAKPVSL